MLDFCLRIIKPCWCLFGGIDRTRVSWFVVCFLLFLFKSLFWNMRDIHLRAAAASFLSHDQTRVLLLDEIFTGCKIKVSSGLSIVCFCLRKLKRLIAVQGRGWMSWWLCHAVVLQDGGIHPRLVEVCLEAPQDSLMRHSHRAVASSSPSSSSADFFTPRQLRLCLLAQNPPLPRGVCTPIALAGTSTCSLPLTSPSFPLFPSTPPPHTHTHLLL